MLLGQVLPLGVKTFHGPASSASAYLTRGDAEESSQQPLKVT